MEIPRYHRLSRVLQQLEGTECGACGIRHYPVRRRCPSCHGRDLRACLLARTGELLSYTEVFNIPEGFSQTPYLLGIIRLDDGVNIVAQLTDLLPDEVHCGMRVEMVVRKIRQDGSGGLIVYGYKFRGANMLSSLSVDLEQIRAAT